MKRVLAVFARRAGCTRGVAGEIAATPRPAGTLTDLHRRAAQETGRTLT